MKISVTIITKNEEKNIGDCIDSVKQFADEIIVVDSFSSDATVDIALKKGAIVKREKFRGHIEQKNLAVQYASNNFIFSIDADERPDQTLIESITIEKKLHSAKAFSMNRCAYFCGQRITHGLWYPDKKLRLFDRRIAKWGGINPHDKILLNKPGDVKHLRGNILHYSYNSIEECRNKRRHLTSVYAESMFKAGKKTSLFKMIVNPIWEFVHGFIFRAGFLDGYYGFIISLETAKSVFMKHSKLHQLQKDGFYLINKNSDNQKYQILQSEPELQAENKF
ncbi:MAG TPA: glycosyltransferase family 2 protein [Puia sp.]|nr:glycosyltransferase family 2 protein [Puia sp.]